LYQDLALRFWLPKAVRESNAKLLEPVHKLGELLEQHDSDSWLKEFMARLSPGDSKSVEALSKAIRGNRKGSYGLALEQSRLAEKLFAQQNNQPGELRARFETIYASQRSLEGFDCLNQIASVEVPARYLWLQIQFDLEKYTCSNLQGEFASTEQGLAEDRKRAEDAHLHLLALRSIAFAAGIIRQQQAGCREVWQQVVQGLGLYWKQGIDAPERLYEFYSILEQCAVQTGLIHPTELIHAAEALQRHSIELLQSVNQDPDPDLILEGSAHAELAAILAAESKDSEADAEQETAESLWKKAGDEGTANIHRLFARIHLAEIRLNRGDAERALSTLASAKDLLTSTQYQLLSLDFYRVQGSAFARLNRLADAASAYRRAISIAENSLRSIPKDSGDRLKWVNKADEVYRGMTRVWLRQGRVDAAWKLWEWYKSRSLAEEPASRASASTSSVTWEGIQARIAQITLPSERHVVYASFEDGVQIWTTDKSGIKGNWASIQQQKLQQDVIDFAKKCADQSASPGDLSAEGQQLYSLLLQQAVSDLPRSSVVVVELDRPLSGLIVPALIDSNGEFFLQNHPVVYSAGVLVDQKLRPARPIDITDRVLVVDTSEPSGRWVVPGHVEEREAALHSYSHVRLASGDRETPMQIQREVMTSTVFDFIGHAEQHGSRVELRLSSNGWLTPDDLPPAVLTRLKLAILAACSTGIGGDGQLLDTDNLIHSFISGGVPEIIASQWNVDSAATAQLMRKLHAHLGAGETVSQALYHAQNEMLLINNRPYFWAGFNLFGRAD
jgi:CHAT domain-containing protein/predicted negative regulator of RcsB-dependent stress response